MRFQREFVLADLKQGITEVHFIKNDGSERIMKCTLDPHLMPPQMKKEDVEAAKRDTNSTSDKINVWDVENKGWRSFKLSTVTYLQHHFTY